MIATRDVLVFCLIAIGALSGCAAGSQAPVSSSSVNPPHVSQVPLDSAEQAYAGKLEAACALTYRGMPPLGASYDDIQREVAGLRTLEASLAVDSPSPQEFSGWLQRFRQALDDLAVMLQGTLATDPAERAQRLSAFYHMGWPGGKDLSQFLGQHSMGSCTQFLLGG